VRAGELASHGTVEERARGRELTDGCVRTIETARKPLFVGVRAGELASHGTVEERARGRELTDGCVRTINIFSIGAATRQRPMF
jgi:hypothetical protein